VKLKVKELLLETPGKPQLLKSIIKSSIEEEEEWRSGKFLSALIKDEEAPVSSEAVVAHTQINVITTAGSLQLENKVN